MRPGDIVSPGDPLLQLRDSVVEVDYRGTQRRVEQALVTRLRARASSDSDAPVRALVDELVRARAQAQLYRVRAEVAGEVVGVRSRPGDEVKARAVLATVRESGPGELIAAVDIPSHAAEKVQIGAKVLISFGDGHDAKRSFEVISLSDEAVNEAAELREQGGQESARNQLRFWARYVDDRPGLPAPKTGMTGRAELVYRDRSLFAALADIVLGEGL